MSKKTNKKQNTKKRNKKRLCIILGIIFLLLMILYFVSKLLFIFIVTKDHVDRIYDVHLDNSSYKEVTIDKKLLSDDEYYTYKNIKFKNIVNGFDVEDSEILRLKKDDKIYAAVSISEDNVAKMYNKLNENYDTNETLGFQMNYLLVNFYPEAEKDFILDNNLTSGMELEKLCKDYRINKLSIFDSFKKIAINGSFLGGYCSIYKQTFFNFDNYEGVYEVVNDSSVYLSLYDNSNVYGFYFFEYFDGSEEDVITQVEDFISSIVIE